MMKITNWKVLLNWVDITNRPIYDYIWVSREGSRVLHPSIAEQRTNGNRIDIIDDWDRYYYEIRHNYELEWIESNRRVAERKLQHLVDEEDYYNGNEKVDEFYFDN